MLFTIGYGKREISQFLEILNKNRITNIIDVRSYPYSKWMQDYNKNNLEQFLNNNGINYKSYPSLGGYSENNELKQSAIEKVKELEKTNTVAIMCSEQDPNRCHRKELSREITKDAIHIDKNGTTLNEIENMCIF